MKARFRSTLAVLLLLAAGPPAARARTPVTVQLDWRLNVQFAGLLLAQERGWYREAGLDVTVLPVDPEMRMVERVLAGTNWIGSAESGVLLAARAAGAPVRAFGTMFQGTPMGLMSLKARGITRPADLVGRRVGIHPDGQRALDLVLASAGLARGQLTILEKPHDLGPLLRGEFDAVQGYAIDEAVALAAAGTEINVLPYHEHGYAAYSQVYFTAVAFLERDPAAVAAFLAASSRGWRAAAADPAATARFVVARHAPDLDPGYQERSLRAIVPLLTREGGPGSEGAMEPATWHGAVAAYNRAQGSALTVQDLVLWELPAAPGPLPAARRTNSLGAVLVRLPRAGWMAVHETRVGDFARFVAETGHDAAGGMMTLGAEDHDWLPKGHTWREPGFPQADDHPVVGVNWHDAQAYCAWLTARERRLGAIGADEGYRLPDDREWSLAVGLPPEPGATPEERLLHAPAVYPWGAAWPPPPGFGNYAGTESAAGKPSWWGTIPGGYTDAFPRTAPVGRFPASALGLHDLSGNAWEWCADAFTTSSLARLTRGGCWGSDRPAYLLSGRRSHMFPAARNDETGFRVLLAAAPAAR
jgi:ABC-type nitrate/sulfonate/bicarbonate transport system substrate-binding protein/formylglycine-generating enzyme required for sulfatase activity